MSREAIIERLNKDQRQWVEDLFRENERLRDVVDAATGLFENRNGITDPDDPEFVSMWKAIGRLRKTLEDAGLLAAVVSGTPE